MRQALVVTGKTGIVKQQLGLGARFWHADVLRNWQPPCALAGRRESISHRAAGCDLCKPLPFISSHR